MDLAGSKDSPSIINITNATKNSNLLNLNSSNSNPPAIPNTIEDTNVSNSSILPTSSSSLGDAQNRNRNEERIYPNAF